MNKLKIKRFFRNINLNDEKTKDFIAGLIALIFVVIAGYLALNRFNNPNERQLGTGGQIEVEDENSSISANEEEAPKVAGETDQNGMDTKWVATDYKEGDIETGKYTVKEGDTLWEISEAVYGDGAMWNKILEANSSNIGYLPNGSQALIVTGQTLVIPQI